MAKLYVFTPPTQESPAQKEAYKQAAGVAMSLQWSADVLPPAQGGWDKTVNGLSAGYNFTEFDKAIRRQLSMGAKELVVVLSPIGFGGSNKSTPNYVFTPKWANSIQAPQLYTAAGTDYPGSGAIPPGQAQQGRDNTAFPAVWTPAFKVAWVNAFSAALAHMKGEDYAAKIAYIRVGGGAGGEWFPWATATKTPGLLRVPGGPTSIAELLPVWLDYMASIHAAISAVGTGFKFVQSLNGGYATQAVPYTYADEAARLAASHGFGMGQQGLKQADLTAFEAHGRESGADNVSGYSTADSAHLFYTYPHATPLEAQTSTASSPSGENATGSLTTLLPYATDTLGATTIELYYEDWLVTYDTKHPQHAKYGADYQAAFEKAGTFVGPA